MLTKQEVGRQTLHLLIGTTTILLLYFEILSTLALFLMVITGILVSIISKRIRLPIFSFFLDHFEREDERKHFPGKGMIFFFIGSLLVVKLFPKDIALASITILTLGDSVSHVIGERFGHLKNIFNEKGKKLFEGTLGGALAGFVGALLFVPLSQALVGSFVAMVAEVVKIDFNENTIDDNLVVPLVAGVVMYLMQLYL